MKLMAKIFLLLLTFFVLYGCASIKKKAEVSTGIRGIVIPMDEKGREILLQDREKIIVNILPVNNGKIDYENSITVNPDNSGNFSVNLKEGMYSVEVFLEGFYVKSFRVKVEKGKFTDLGKIYIKKIETESASPIKGDEGIGEIQNGGDVNIQPPSY